MIDVIFMLGGDHIFVRVIGNNIKFSNSSQGNLFASIEGMKLSKAGVIKEFPDLKDNENWKLIAIERFKEKIKECKTENEKVEYIIKDLSKFGYKPLYKKKAGFRTERIK
jgi:hypothetical protein